MASRGTSAASNAGATSVIVPHQQPVKSTAGQDDVKPPKLPNISIPKSKKQILNTIPNCFGLPQIELKVKFAVILQI